MGLPPGRYLDLYSSIHLKLSTVDTAIITAFNDFFTGIEAYFGAVEHMPMSLHQ